MDRLQIQLVGMGRYSSHDMRGLKPTDLTARVRYGTAERKGWRREEGAQFWGVCRRANGGNAVRSGEATFEGGSILKENKAGGSGSIQFKRARH